MSLSLREKLGVSSCLSPRFRWPPNCVFGSEAATLTKLLQRRYADIIGRDYVLCVGTIEVRKNHLLLVKIWESDSRWSWATRCLIWCLSANGAGILRRCANFSTIRIFFDGRVRVVTNASDAALVQLYRHCLMTTYVSFAEGFGLPVGESLAYGKPCVASRATSLPEVGGEFAKYIDPNDADEGVRLFKALFTDRERIAAWARVIETHYAPKTWRAFTAQLLDACGRMAGDTAQTASANNCLLRAGATYQLGNSAINQIEDERPLASFRMSRDAHWHPLEDWGCWSSERDSSLAFRCDLPAGAALLVALRLQATPDSHDAAATVAINDGRPRRFALYRAAAWFVVAGEVAADGRVRIQFRCNGDFGQPDTRSLFVGLQALEIQRDSVAVRSALLRRSLISRGIAATRRAAAKIAGGRRRASGRQDDDLRRIAREMLDARLAEPGAQALRFLVPDGEARGALALAFPGPGVLTAPAGLYMTSANCLARDFYAAEFASFCAKLGRAVELHRRLWEYAFVAHHLQALGALGPGRTGYAASDADDPLPAYFAERGCEIDRLAAGRYNFLWSVNAVLANGPGGVLDLIETRLKPGGAAVLTGDLNLSAFERRSGAETPSCLTRAEIEVLAQALSARGHKVTPLPFELGLTSLDAVVELPPYESGVHLKILQRGAVVTCFGLAIVAGRVADAGGPRDA